MTRYTYLTALIAGVLILQGCSQLPQQSQPTNTIATPSPSVKAPARAFPPETLYALLVAELAGSRERYDIALGNYMQQAHKTRDPGIAARATHIARYLNARQAALNSALLWVELDSADMEAHFISASELAQAGRLNEAFDHSLLLLAEGSRAPIFPAIAARAVKATDTQREQLLARFVELQLQHPKNADLLISLGLLYQQQHQLTLALEATSAALKLDDSLIPAAILEAKLLSAMKRPAQALARLDTLLLHHPDNKRLRLQYARLLANSDLKKAQAQFKILVEKSPDDPELIFSLALISNERGLIAEAESYFNKLLEHPKHGSSAHYYLGRIMEKRENYEQALLHYVKVQPGPDFMPALLQSTDIMVRAKRLDLAHERLKNARKSFPSQAERFYLLEAEVLSKHMHLEPARSLLSQGLSQFPTSTQLLYSRAMVNEQLNLMQQLEGDLRSILKYDPNNATALNALGYTLADRTDRIAEAYQLISQALQINPDDPAIIDSMGWVQYRMGNLEESLLRLRQAMQAFPDHEIAAHLGEVLWANEQRDEAKRIWRQGLQLTPKSRIIRAVMLRLEAHAE